MMNYLKIFLSVIFLYSCATESNIYEAKKFYLSKSDTIFQIDSFKVVNVIDNRLVKDAIIGEVDYDKRPMIIDRPLTDYLKMSFNSLLCKDTNKKFQYPITVTVDEFYSGRNGNFLRHCAYFKYAYKFDYTYNDKEIKLIVKDSFHLCGDPELNQQRYFIRAGIKSAAWLFLYNHFKNYPLDSTRKLLLKSDTNKTKLDTLDLPKLFKYYRKDGILVNTQTGLKMRNGFSISYLELLNLPWVKTIFNLKSTQYDAGLGLGIQWGDIVNNNFEGTFIGVSIPYNRRFHFTNINEGFFINFSVGLSIVTEKIRKNDFHGFYVGGRLEESIGYNFTNYFGATFGSYQTGHIKANLLGSDLGLVLSLFLTTSYCIS